MRAVMSWLWTILSGAVLLAVAAWIKFRISNRRTLQLFRNIPSVTGCYPLIGHLHLFCNSSGNTVDNLRRIIEETVLQGHRAMCLWVGPYPIVLVTHPDDIKKVLNNSLSRGKEVEESCKEYMKYGLLTSPVNHWKATRKHLNLTFHTRNVEKLDATFNWRSRQLVDDLSRLADGNVLNLMPHVMSAALRSMCTFLYGTETMERVSNDLFEDLRHAVGLAGELAALRVPRPWLHNERVFKFLYGKEINMVKKTFLRLLRVANTNDAERGRLTDSSELTDTDSPFQTILEAMRELQKKSLTVTDQHVKDEMTSSFAAGTDTIGATVSSCLLALASHPHIQEKLYKEICSTVDPGEDITHDDLKRLVYLDQVIKETLRFFTVLPFMTRSSTADTNLEEYTLPANEKIVLCIGAVCFDPKYFPEPYTFDPDRFSTANNSRDSYFMPFGRGPRNCIGKPYAMNLSKVMVAHVVRAYKLSTMMDIKNLKIKFMTTLTSREGYNVSLSKRNCE